MNMNRVNPASYFDQFVLWYESIETIQIFKRNSVLLLCYFFLGEKNKDSNDKENKNSIFQFSM